MYELKKRESDGTFYGILYSLYTLSCRLDDASDVEHAFFKHIFIYLLHKRLSLGKIILLTNVIFCEHSTINYANRYFYARQSI